MKKTKVRMSIGQLRTQATTSAEACSNLSTTRPIALNPLLCHRCNRMVDSALQCSSGQQCWVVRNPTKSQSRTNRAIGRVVTTLWDQKPRQDSGFEEHFMDV